MSDDAWVGAKHDPSLLVPPDPKHEIPEAHTTELPVVVEGKPTLSEFPDLNEFPSEEEIVSLRRVADKIPLRVYTVAFVELCERFSYYGTQILCKLVLVVRLR